MKTCTSSSLGIPLRQVTCYISTGSLAHSWITVNLMLPWLLRDCKIVSINCNYIRAKIPFHTLITTSCTLSSTYLFKYFSLPFHLTALQVPSNLQAQLYFPSLLFPFLSSDHRLALTQKRLSPSTPPHSTYNTAHTCRSLHATPRKLHL